MKAHLKTKPFFIPVIIIILYRIIKHKEIRKNHLEFLFKEYPIKISFFERLKLVYLIHNLPYKIESGSTETEELAFVDSIFSIPKSIGGSVAEVGVFKGGASCIYSIASFLAGRKFYLFDSFEGIPDNDEVNEHNLHKNNGGVTKFKKGDYFGPIDEVKNNLKKFGAIDNCIFVKGFVEDTLPSINEKFIAVYCDVDLASATKTTLQYIFPLISEGGYFYSQDGHLSEVIKVFNDLEFWKTKLDLTSIPKVNGLNVNKLIYIQK